jgi:hypothetical protein
MQNVNFTGHLIYFDYQQRDCKLDYQHTSFSIEKSSFKPKYHTYYRSTLSFRSDPDHFKSSNSTELNSSVLLNETHTKLDLCDNKITINEEYFSYSYFLTQLPKSYQLHSRSLFDSLNSIIHLLNSNVLDCKTLRLKQTKKPTIYSNFQDINIYSTRKSNSNSYKKQIAIIGRYSSIHDEYHSCQSDQRKDLFKLQNTSPSRIYYITSVFDEPFLMLRKRTPLQIKYNQPQADLKELRGRIFDFDEIEGYCVDLAEKVCSILNITCKYRIVHDGGFGSKNATTGIWNGKEYEKSFKY